MRKEMRRSLHRNKHTCTLLYSVHWIVQKEECGEITILIRNKYSTLNWTSPDSVILIDTVQKNVHTYTAPGRGRAETSQL